MSLLRIANFVIAAALMSVASSNPVIADDLATGESRPKRVLLLGQKPDTHPKTTHEYMAGIRIIAGLLQDRKSIQVVVCQADSPWSDGPQLLDGADAVVLYLTEGAQWISADQQRLAAFERFAKRGGGLTCLHWGMGTREAPPVAIFVSLFGGCHGGPDRRYKIGDYHVMPAMNSHPITSGISPFDVHEELYYHLKFPTSREGLTMLLQTHIDDADYAVAWAWERPDRGRSFGFSGLHFHENWRRIEYRRLVIQGILWTLRDSIPSEGLLVDVTETDLILPQDEAGK